MNYSTLKCHSEGRVLVVELDNPPRNLMNALMVDELDDLVRGLEGNRAIGSVVLTSAMPGIFITHYDVEEIVEGAESFGRKVTPAQAGAALRSVGMLARAPGGRGLLSRTPLADTLAILKIHALFNLMNRMDKVFIAAINGSAFGGGLELALTCDIRLMAKGDHRVGLPEALIGLIPGAGGTQRLARLLGPGRALEIMLEGRAMSAEEAESLGVVHRAVAGKKLPDEAMETAARIARRSPEGIAALKRAVYEGSSLPLAAGQRVEAACFMHLVTTEPALRAMRTFADEGRDLAGALPAELINQLERWREGHQFEPGE